MLTKHSYIHVYIIIIALCLVKNQRKCTQKVTCCPWNDAKGHNHDDHGTELFRNDRFVSRVGLNHISQHIKLRGKTNKYALFSPFTHLYL